MSTRLTALREGFTDLVEGLLDELRALEQQNLELRAQRDAAQALMHDLVARLQPAAAVTAVVPIVAPDPSAVVVTSYVRTFSPRVCRLCAGEFEPNGANQKLCKLCRAQQNRRPRAQAPPLVVHQPADDAAKLLMKDPHALA